MEKYGNIEPGRTPPEKDGQKEASLESLEDGPRKRLADRLSDSFKEAITARMLEAMARDEVIPFRLIPPSAAKTE